MHGTSGSHLEITRPETPRTDPRRSQVRRCAPGIVGISYTLIVDQDRVGCARRAAAEAARHRRQVHENGLFRSVHEARGLPDRTHPRPATISKCHLPHEGRPYPKLTEVVV
jgi:hypothetical protein